MCYSYYLLNYDDYYAKAAREPACIEGACSIALRHGDAVAGMQWSPHVVGELPALLATVTVSGAVTLWRESAPSEPLTFIIEAYWEASDFWMGAPGAPLVSPEVGMAACLHWASPRRGVSIGGAGFQKGSLDRGEGDRLPLQPSGHGPGAVCWSSGQEAASGPALSTLVLLGAGGHAAAVHVETRRVGGGIPLCPLDIRKVLLSVPLPAAGLRSSTLLNAAVATGEEGRDILELLISAGGDMLRARLEQADIVAVSVAAGGVFSAVPSVCGVDAGSCSEPAPHGMDEDSAREPPPRVQAVAVHRTFGCMACLVQHSGSPPLRVYPSAFGRISDVKPFCFTGPLDFAFSTLRWLRPEGGGSRWPRGQARTRPCEISFRFAVA